VEGRATTTTRNVVGCTPKSFESKQNENETNVFSFFFFLFASVHTPPHQRRLVSGARVGGSAVVTRWAPFYAPTTFSIPCELFVEFFLPLLFYFFSLEIYFIVTT
jgi:hypothetical protein